MSDHPVTGALSDWADVADRGWRALMIGNGMSINVSRYFAYKSLFKEANKPAFKGGLKDRDRAVFEAFDTTNFEVVLAKLRDGIALAEVLGRNPDPYRRRFRSVQSALGKAVRRVHLEWTEVPDDTLAVIKDELQGYKTVFSTCYDLLTYWAMFHGGDCGCLCDCFWSNDRNEFDPDRCRVWTGYTPIYYLHGALHLVVEGSGVTRKLVKEHGRLLDQFGKPVPDDPEARPLLISEGSARDKLRAIEGNDYLSHVYDTFKETADPLLVFGQAFGEQDHHLIEAINAAPDRPVAISMVDEGESRLREEQARIYGKLRTEEVYFYDAATHPLGSPDLRVELPRVRFMGRWYPDRSSTARA